MNIYHIEFLRVILSIATTTATTTSTTAKTTSTTPLATNTMLRLLRLRPGPSARQRANSYLHPLPMPWVSSGQPVGGGRGMVRGGECGRGEGGAGRVGGREREGARGGGRDGGWGKEGVRNIEGNIKGNIKGFLHTVGKYFLNV